MEVSFPIYIYRMEITRSSADTPNFRPNVLRLLLSYFPGFIREHTSLADDFPRKAAFGTRALCRNEKGKMRGGPPPYKFRYWGGSNMS